MLDYIIYFLIAIAATTIGAATGMGGGVMIKPVLDIMNDFNVATIGVLSSITVFAMAIVSVLKQMHQKVKINFEIAVPLALGSVAGGSIGQYVLTIIISILNANRLVMVVQNIALAILIIGVFLYMLNKSNIGTLGIKNIVLVVTTGIFLGIISAFLGIGGGPINVALLIYLFSLDIKIATLCSIITILFAQMSNLSQIAVITGFAIFDLSMLPPMVIGATAGGFIGSWFTRNLSEKTVEICFSGVQIIVLIFCIFNITKNLMYR